MGQKQSVMKKLTKKLRRGDSELEQKRLFEEKWKTKYGDMLSDDLINHVVAIIQTKSPKKIGGLFAVKYSNLLHEKIAREIRAEQDAVQILFDDEREHYFLAHYRADLKIVVIYDSSLENGGDHLSSAIPVTLRKKLYSLFGHLFPDGKMRIAIDIGYCQQYSAREMKYCSGRTAPNFNPLISECILSDSFSSGHQTIGCLIDIASSRDPKQWDYSRWSLYRVIETLATENSKNYDWDDVANCSFGNVCEFENDSWYCFFLHGDATLTADYSREELDTSTYSNSTRHTQESTMEPKTAIELIKSACTNDTAETKEECGAPSVLSERTAVSDVPN